MVKLRNYCKHAFLECERQTLATKPVRCGPALRFGLGWGESSLELNARNATRRRAFVQGTDGAEQLFASFHVSTLFCCLILAPITGLFNAAFDGVSRAKLDRAALGFLCTQSKRDLCFLFIAVSLAVA